MPLEMVLGTANFGNLYGQSRRLKTEPTVNKELARRIVAAAREMDIKEIDTALTYGPAQSWLAEFPESTTFQINSKIPWLGIRQFDYYSKQILQISELFGLRRIQNIQFHNWNCSYTNFRDFNNFYEELSHKSHHLFGVTTYGGDTVRDALNLSCFNSIQLEFNVLNQKALNTYKSSLVLTKPKLYMRSLLLQGFLTESGSISSASDGQLRNLLSKVRQLSHQWGLPIYEIALRFVMSEVETGSVVVGVESEKQLQELFQVFNKGPLPAELIIQMRELDSSDNPVVDPRNWKIND